MPPLAYRSQADSPFPLGSPGFHLEDFEDGELNTPGVYQPVYTVFGSTFHGFAVHTNGVADSVDGDDGSVDGLNSGGASFRSGWHLTTLTFPPGNQFVLDFDFDAVVLGSLPNAVGFALTDAPRGNAFGGRDSMSLFVTDALGQLHFSPAMNVVDDFDRSGGVSDDWFYGVTGVDAGVMRLTILVNTHGEFDVFEYFEIDHLQYGVVPEPSAIAIAACGLLAMAPIQHRRGGIT